MADQVSGMSKGVVFVTGGTKNSGLATVRRFASDGYDVVLTSRSQADADTVAAAVAAEFGVRAKGYEMQLTDLAAIRAVFEDVQAQFGRLDVLCLIAGHLAMGCTTLTTDEAVFREIVDTNITGNFFCCQCAARIMEKAHSGSIVVLGSVHALQAVCDRTVYSMTKGALLSMVKAMAIDLGMIGVRINYVSAGAIRTDRWDVYGEEWVKDRRERYPAGRESSVEDIANAIHYLGSDLGRSITGTDFVVDSGITCCLLPFKKPTV